MVRLDLARLRPGQGYHFLHRADLIDLLLEGAEEAGVTLRLLSRVEAVDLAGPQPAVVLAGRRAARDAAADRGGWPAFPRCAAALNGAETAVLYRSGRLARGDPREPGAAPVAEVHMGPGRHLVSYPLRGGTLRNIVAVEERATWAEESWTLRDDRWTCGWPSRASRPAFGAGWTGWRTPGFGACSAIRWPRPGPAAGRAVAILGDAAHPTLPFLAQGASMGLEDAWVLADALAAHDTLAAGAGRLSGARASRARRGSWRPPMPTRGPITCRACPG